MDKFVLVAIAIATTLIPMSRPQQSICLTTMSENQSFLQSYLSEYTQKYYARCSSITGFFTCTRYRISHQVSHRVVYRTVYRAVYVCCDGWYLNDGTCKPNTSPKPMSQTVGNPTTPSFYTTQVSTTENRVLSTSGHSKTITTTGYPSVDLSVTPESSATIEQSTTQTLEDVTPTPGDVTSPKPVQETVGKTSSATSAILTSGDSTQSVTTTDNTVKSSYYRNTDLTQTSKDNLQPTNTMDPKQTTSSDPVLSTSNEHIGSTIYNHSHWPYTTENNTAAIDTNDNYTFPNQSTEDEFLSYSNDNTTSKTDFADGSGSGPGYGSGDFSTFVSPTADFTLSRNAKPRPAFYAAGELDNAVTTLLQDLFSKGNSNNNSMSSADYLNQLEELQEQLLLVVEGLEINSSVQIAWQDIVIELVKFESAAGIESYQFSSGNLSNSYNLRIASGTIENNEIVGIVAMYNQPSQLGAVEFRTSNVPSSGDPAASQMVSGIISLSVTVGGTKKSVGVDFSLNVEEEMNSQLDTQIYCAFWIPIENSWSDTGCELLSTSGGMVQCLCDHTTNFAILTQIVEKPLTIHDVILSMIGRVVGGVSIVCLYLTVISYLFLRLLGSLSIKVHANLSISLATANLLFLIAGNGTHGRQTCKTVAFILHYLYLVVFMWMLVEGVILYRKTSVSQNKTQKFAPLFAFAWGLPLGIVALSGGIRFQQYASRDLQSCWLSTQHGLIWAFLGPAFLIVLVNIIIVLIVMKTFMKLKVNLEKREAEKIRTALRAVVMMTPILGLTWIFGLFSSFHVTFEYLFVISLSTQGIMIFVCYCVKNTEVRRAFAKKRGKIGAADSGGSTASASGTLVTRMEGT
ncbi:adhesion G protein-coupled receptor L3-like [Amphiura filiformis]|uniref:adhesion G protein-coupled receptor L3-like n=1 Tax=Amphiura filiformis TaxID=82378 RepID=UPI003B21557C